MTRLIDMRATERRDAVAAWAAQQRLRSLPETAAHLGIAVSTLKEWARLRKVPHRRFGRRVLFAPEDILAIIAHASRPARRTPDG